MNELIQLLVRINLVLAATIVLVLLLRATARRLFGARIAYALWALPLFAGAMCFVPARVVHIVVTATHGATFTPPITVNADQPYLFWAWAGGALLSMLVLALRQLRFTRALGRLHRRGDLGAGVLGAESKTHGPAVIGVLRPVIVTPADFDARFDAEEQRIVLAHERAHLAQGDPWVNAVTLLLQCVNWFNPLVHLGARALRVDQELACDAAVLSQAEGARRRYAETMLKTQLAAAVPIGCAWPPSTLAALKERIAMLKRNLPTRTQRLVGASTIALATVAACAAAWAAQPARLVATLSPTAAAPVTAASAPLPPDVIDMATHIAANGRELPKQDALEGADEVEPIDDSPVIIAHERDLTPAQRAQIRAAVADAREQADGARDQAIAAREQASAAHEQAAAAREQAAAARDQAAAAIAEARDAARAVEATRAGRAEAVERARIEVRIAEVDASAARAAMAHAPEVQAEIRAARAAVAEAAVEARAAHDAVRAERLERAVRVLDHNSEAAEPAEVDSRIQN
jgi:beta-lactamase regulating signal transducer with metallopeptidase domain